MFQGSKILPMKTVTSTLNLQDVGGLPPSRSVAPPRPGVSLCSFCEDGALYRPEDGPPDVATVRYADTLACGFHAVFLWGDQPAREFRGLFP
jgi:hypothetical protein